MLTELGPHSAGRLKGVQSRLRVEVVQQRQAVKIRLLPSLASL